MSDTVVRVTQVYIAQYPDPIDAQEGAVVQVDRPDADNPEWWWCRAADGRSGWVPAVLLDPSPAPAGVARLRTRYSARELSVRLHEELVVEQVHAGWLLVSNRGGERGWVPVTHVEP